MNSDKINAIIKKKTNGNNDLSLHLHQMFFFEHVLMRLEKSKYKDNIILKGGVLLSSIIGSDMRTTKDIDATLKSLPLNENSIRNIFSEILSIDIKDDFIFKIESIKKIRLKDQYGGYRINVYGKFDNLKYKYNSIFEDKTINIMAYNFETIVAEKFHSIISKNINTTRAKDFYDIYIIMNKYINNINKDTLTKAIKKTFNSRNTNCNLKYLQDVFNEIKDSISLNELFKKYSEKLTYAKNIEFEDTIKAIHKIMEILEKH